MPFDPDHFRQKCPGRAFPELRFCADRQRWHTDQQLAAAFGLASLHPGSILWSLFDRAAPVALDAGETPDVGRLLALCDPHANDDLYLDWYLGEQAQVGRADVLSCFDAYWQKGVDDMALFDDSFQWVLYFTRDGGARLLRAGENPPGHAPDMAPDL